MGLTAALMVVARSAAEMPVVTPLAASMETQKAVSNLHSFRSAIMPRPSWLAFSWVRVMQIRPRPNLAMKLICSGVTSSAAMHKSPSFSRSSSSTRMIILPFFMSSMASGMVARGIGASLAFIPGIRFRPGIPW